MKPVVTDYRPFAAFLTLFDKEVLRFRKIALHAILAPILTSILYLLVFGEVLKGKMSVLGGVDYVAFLIPGLVMMALLQNAFANSASSILQSKIMGSIVFIELPPFSGWQLAAAFISASVARGLIVGAGVFAATCLWTQTLISFFSIPNVACRTAALCRLISCKKVLIRQKQAPFSYNIAIGFSINRLTLLI